MILNKTKRMCRGQHNVNARVGELPERHDIVRTPQWLIDVMLGWANVQRNEYVLDPFAGDNRIIEALWCRAAPLFTSSIEIISDACQPRGVINSVIETDFFSYIPEYKFDCVIMNPPFSKNQAFTSVERLITGGWLVDDGRIITLMPNYSLDNGEGRKPFMNKYLHRLAYIPKNTFAPQVPVLHGSLVEFRMNHESFATHNHFIVNPKSPARVRKSKNNDNYYDSF